MQVKKTGVQPWYREPFVWLLILLPATAVVAGLFTLRLALNSDDGLVTDDYYKKGLEINRVLERDKRAEALALEADIHFDRGARTLTARLHARDPDILPQSLSLKLMHSTRAGFDRDVALDRTADGIYFAVLPQLAAGRWYAQIESADWRILKSFIVDR